MPAFTQIDERHAASWAETALHHSEMRCSANSTAEAKLGGGAARAFFGEQVTSIEETPCQGDGP